MALNRSLLVARALWLAPLLLLLLTFNQIKVALDLRETLDEGVPAQAEVIEYSFSDRADVTYDYVSLRIALPGGREMIREKVSLPHTFAAMLEGKEQVAVRVREGAAQEVVIEEIGRAHWRVAAINAGMSFFGFVFFGLGIFWWNRYLTRRGDPASRSIEETEGAEHVSA